MHVLHNRKECVFQLVGMYYQEVGRQGVDVLSSRMSATFFHPASDQDYDYVITPSNVLVRTYFSIPGHMTFTTLLATYFKVVFTCRISPHGDHDSNHKTSFS